MRQFGTRTTLTGDRQKLFDGCLQVRIAVADVACRDLSPAGVPTSMWLIHRRHDQSPASATFVALATANRQAKIARRTSSSDG